MRMSLLRTIDSDIYGAEALAMSPDGAVLAAWSHDGTWMDDGTIKLWDLASGTCVRTLEGATRGAPHSVAMFPDGTRIVSGSRDKTIKVWDVQSGACLRTFVDSRNGGVEAVAVFPDGTHIVSGSGTYSGAGSDDEDDERYLVTVWNVASGNWVRRFRHPRWVNAVAVFPDGMHIVSGAGCCMTGHLKVWSMATGSCVWNLDHHGPLAVSCLPDTMGVTYSGVRSVAVSPNGEQIVSAGGGIKLWSMASGMCVRSFTGHSDMVSSLALSSDGAFMVSGSTDNTIKLWDLVTGACVRTCAHETSLRSVVALSADGARIVSSGGGPRIIKIWRGPRDQSRMLHCLLRHRVGATYSTLPVEGNSVLKRELYHFIYGKNNVDGDGGAAEAEGSAVLPDDIFPLVVRYLVG